MRTQSAITTITHAVTVAGGVFAPGHLGELTQYLPFELVDDVLAETKTVQRRLRALPSRAGVYFVLALAMFPHLGYLRVWGKLTAGLAGLELPRPSEKALRDLRRRIGPAPLKALFEIVAGPLAQPRTPGVRFGGLRTVAFDGCNSMQIPDTDRNRRWIGKHPLPDGPGRVSGAAADGAGRDRHPGAAGRGRRLGRRPGRVTPGPAAAAAAGPGHAGAAGPGIRRQRVPGRGRRHRGACCWPGPESTRNPPWSAHLPDGSYLSRPGRPAVRIIEADVAMTGADGTRVATATG